MCAVWRGRPVPEWSPAHCYQPRTLRSIRPGRMSAGSSDSMRLVAMMTCRAEGWGVGSTALVRHDAGAQGEVDHQAIS